MLVHALDPYVMDQNPSVEHKYMKTRIQLVTAPYLEPDCRFEYVNAVEPHSADCACEIAGPS